MIKFNVAQENFLTNNFPEKLSDLLGNKKLEDRDINSKEFLYVFQEIARASTRMYLSSNRFFETLMLEDEDVDFYYIERIKNLNKAIADAIPYFETLKMTPKVNRALNYMEKDEKEGENVLDGMPKDVPLSLAVVDPETGETELVTLIIGEDDGMATVIDSEGEEFPVPVEKIQSVQMMDEVPDAIQSVSNMGAVSSSDLGSESEEQPEMQEGEMGVDADAESDMEGQEEMPSEEGEEEEKEKGMTKKADSGMEEYMSHHDLFVRQFENSYAPTSSFGYSLEEDIPMSMMKGNKIVMGELYSSTDSIDSGVGNKEDLKETTFKGGFRSDFPDDTRKEVKKLSSSNKEAKAALDAGHEFVKSDSEIKYENRYKKSKVSNKKSARKLVKY